MKSKSIITNHATIKALLPVAIAERQAFKATYDELDPLLNFEQMADTIRAEIDKSKNAEEIHALTGKLALYEGDNARLAKARAMRLAHAAKHKLSDAVRPVVVAALERLAIEKANAVKAEADFFAAHDLPREATSVSRQLNKIESELTHFSNALTEHWPNMMPGRKSFDEFFNYFAE